MKKMALAILLMCSITQANIARSNISSVGVSLYGVFMTSDPSCQVGLVESVPLSKTATNSNFVTAPILGAGPVPTRVACVILVVANQVQVSWKASAYTAPDDVCSAGGTASVNPCMSSSVTWPSIISQAAQRIGLALSNSCSVTPTGFEVVPIFMSIDSVCTGSSVVDSQTSGCTVSGKTTSSVAQAPLTINSSSSGARIQTLPVHGRIVFAVDPDKIISGQFGSCVAVSSPVFSIHQ